MAYGRLDIIYPDGNFRSFALTDSNVSVGRSPGNTITLDTETISRYHFSVTHENGEVRLADMESQNGTYVDGVKIPNGESIPLRGGEEILAGDLRIIYHEQDEQPTQPVRPEGDITQRIQKQDIPFQLSVQPPPISIPPSAHASAELTITNTSDDKCLYSVQVGGVAKEWVRIDRPKVMLNGGESAKVIINVRPPRRPDTAPGEYAITMTVREDNNPAHVLEATTHVHVLPYHGFGVALERKALNGNENFRLHMHNQGSVDLPLVIGGSERQRSVQVQLASTPNVTLPPGGRQVMQGQVKPAQRQIVGSPHTVPFDIVIRSQDPSQFMAVVRGSVTHHPLLPSWLLLVGGAVALLMLLAVMILVSVLTTPTPDVVSLQVQATQVVRGEPLEIQWQVQDVRDLTLLINETPVATLDPLPEGNTYTLETTALPDHVLLSLVGTNRNRADRVDQPVRVYDPIRIESFTVEPDQLVRYVVQPLSLRWELANAAYVQVGGLDVFTTGDVPGGNFSPVDSIDGVLGIPLDDLTVSLYAENTQGDTFTDQIVIPAVQPQCTPADDDVPLRSGPNPLNQQIGIVPFDATVSVDARDVTGAWIRVKLEGGLTGWGAVDAFTCADIFNPADLRQIIDVTPPPPPPTVPPTPTETSVPVAATAEPAPRTPGAVVTPTGADNAATEEPLPTPQPTTAG